MAAFWGARTDQLRALSSSVDTAADRLEGLFTTLDQLVLDESSWRGPDAESFRSRYSDTARRATTAACAALRTRSTTLIADADEQDDVSATDGSGGLGQLLASVPAGWFSGMGATPGIDGSDVSASLGFWDNRGDERSSRRGESRENTPRTDGDDSYDPDADNPNAQYSTPGPEATAPGESGLGEGVPGTDVDAPEPPAWTPPADGAGEHNSEFAGPVDHSVHGLAREGADLMRGKWPNASEHLDHFLDNNGEDHQADVDDLIDDQPQFAQATEERRHQAGHDAVARAQADGATGPVTYPLSTAWDGHTADGDWFYASGSFNYNQTGTVTAYPPDAEHPEWRYEVDTEVNFRDRYNWDGNKSTQIGPFTVEDESLAALHRAGIAREYNLVGESSPQHTEGTVP